MMNRNLDVELRLGEIARRSAELSAVSSRLADMASQLERLRQLNSRIALLTDRNRPSRRGRNGGYMSYKRFRNG